MDVSESHTPFSNSIRIETSVFRKMPGYMHAPWSSALPSAVKLSTVCDVSTDQVLVRARSFTIVL
jgi:hypothetical protein